MLRDAGHEVFQFTAHNDDLTKKTLRQIAVNMLWSGEFKQKMTEKIAEVKPDIVHFHNIFMSISPSAYYACQEAGVPVVQTLHNYRMICPKATLFRDNAICTDCLGSLTFSSAIRHRCYHDSHIQSAGVGVMLNLHKALHTWDKQVDKYICLSERGRQIFIQGGMNPDKLAVKGNFLQYDPGYSDADEDFFIFMGRLTPEKGLRVLIEAWKQLLDIPLKVLGVGELEGEIRQILLNELIYNVELVGHIPRYEALDLLKTATAQIVPSQWHEPFGLVAIEGFACGTPVIASNVGALVDIIEDGENGFHFEATNPDSLVEKVRYIWENREKRQEMSRKARAFYEEKYTSAVNYQQLMSIYEDVLATVKS